MEGSFRNATGTLKLEHFDNVTKHNRQVPKHDQTYSSTLNQKSTRHFDQTQAEKFPENMSGSNFAINPSTNVKEFKQHDVTKPVAPYLATSLRNRNYEQETKSDISMPKQQRLFAPKSYKAADVQNIEKSIGQIRVVRGIQKSIIPVESKAPVYDNYYHGGDVFDDFTGYH